MLEWSIPTQITQRLLISAWLDLFSLTAVAQRQQLWRCGNSQSLAFCSLLRGISLAQRPHRGFISARVSFLLFTHISPGHIYYCCRDHIKRAALHVPLPRVPGLPAAKSLWVKAATISWNSEVVHEDKAQVTQVLLTSLQMCFGGPPRALSLWFCPHHSCVLLEFFKVYLFRNSSCLIPVIRKLPCLAIQEPLW